MKLLFEEQDLIDAICVYGAKKMHVNPEDIIAKLNFHPERGYIGEAEVEDTGDYYEFDNEKLIRAIEFYLEDAHYFLPHRLEIELKGEHSLGAKIKVLTR